MHFTFYSLNYVAGSVLFHIFHVFFNIYLSSNSTFNFRFKPLDRNFIDATGEQKIDKTVLPRF